MHQGSLELAHDRDGRSKHRGELQSHFRPDVMTLWLVKHVIYRVYRTDPQKLEDSHIKDMKKSLANIHHVTREALEFRSKVINWKKTSRKHFRSIFTRKQEKSLSIAWRKRKEIVIVLSTAKRRSYE